MIAAIVKDQKNADQLKEKYYLVEFDGSSDDALDQTWNIKVNEP